jgi:hypothetical protein
LGSDSIYVWALTFIFRQSCLGLSPSKDSRQNLDEIDRVLAAHYGFTDEELDFIINYDIQYRMGRDAESDDE